MAWKLFHQGPGYSAPEAAEMLGFANLPGRADHRPDQPGRAADAGAGAFVRQIQQVPNRVTLPLLAHFPSAAETWSGGDAKRWLALFWLVPGSQAQEGLLVMGAALILTALVQLLWHKEAHRPARQAWVPGGPFLSLSGCG